MRKIIFLIMLPVLLLGCTQQKEEVPAAKETTAQEKIENESTQTEQIIYLQVAPDKVECSGYEGQTECLQVKKVTYTADGKKNIADQQWENFHENIQGYEHNPQQTAILKIKVKDADFGGSEPPADAALQDYVLLEYIEKLPK